MERKYFKELSCRLREEGTETSLVDKQKYIVVLPTEVTRLGIAILDRNKELFDLLQQFLILALVDEAPKCVDN